MQNNSETTTAAGSRYEEGLRLAAAGRPDDAARCFADTLAGDPVHEGAWLGLARLALEAGETRAAERVLEKGLEKVPESSAMRFRLGLLRQRQGDPSGALACFRGVVDAEPGNAGAWLKLGVLQGEIGDPRAAEAVQHAFILKPQLREDAEDSGLPPAMREELRVAGRLLKARYQDMVADSLKLVRERYRGEDLHRIEDAFAFLQGAPKRWCHPGQRPGFLLFPDMAARPWFEREEFDWVGRVEAASDTILEELTGLADNPEGFAPYLVGVSKTGSSVTHTGEDFSALADSMDWNAFHLMKAGDIPGNMARCPETTRLMQSLPLATARDYMPEVFFSVLRPGAHIIPHYGQMNIRLTVHLGLVVPEACGIRVHEETRQWQQGRILVFDDSFLHEAWNRSSRDRVVLIFEVWHPDLSEAEIFGIQTFLEARGEWMSRFPRPDTGAGHAA